MRQLRVPGVIALLSMPSLCAPPVNLSRGKVGNVPDVKLKTKPEVVSAVRTEQAVTLAQVAHKVNYPQVLNVIITASGQRQHMINAWSLRAASR